MFVKPDLITKEVPPPSNLWCQSGHKVAPDTLFQGGPVRFFQVTGIGVNGVYCELCLTVANHKAGRIRDARRQRHPAPQASH